MPALLTSAAAFVFLLLLQAAMFLPLPGVLAVVAIAGVLIARTTSTKATEAWATVERPARIDEELMCLSPSYVNFHAERAGAAHPARWRWVARSLIALNLGLWCAFVVVLLIQAAFGIYLLP